MKKKEIAILSMLIFIGLVLTSTAWTSNFTNIDIFHTNNITYHNRKIQKINESNDIEFVKKEVVDFISMSNSRNSDTSERAVKISKQNSQLYNKLDALSEQNNE